MLKASIAAYRLEEIAAEKLRAVLQGREHLERRGWFQSRPRDIYDLWYLRQQTAMPIDWQEVAALLRVYVPEQPVARTICPSIGKR